MTTDTRVLSFPNGTILGRTYLWLPPFMRKGETIVVDGKPRDETIGEVVSEGKRAVSNCQGFQEVFYVTWGESGYNPKPPSGSADFDRDTGILSMGDIPLPIIDVLGFGWFTESIYSILDTNVDLGPQYLKTAILHAILDNLPVVLPAVVLVAAVLLVVKRRRRLKRNVN